MEKLSEEQRFKVSKMNDERLRKKLVQAGYKEVHIIGLDRTALLTYVAQVILAKTAYVPEQIEGQFTADDGGSNEDGEEELAMGGGVSAELTENRSLEERRLWLEERKLEEQTLQLEEQRLQREKQRLQLEEQRLQ